jgi:hypothetical protein
MQPHTADAENCCMFFKKGTWWLGSGLKEEIAAQHMRWLVWV